MKNSDRAYILQKAFYYWLFYGIHKFTQKYPTQEVCNTFRGKVNEGSEA
jgi:hypothetical protein